MQAMLDLMRKNQPAQETQESHKKQAPSLGKQLPMKWQQALFERFKSVYRNKFMSKFASAAEYNETMREWGIALADLTPDQLKCGIEQSIKTLAWPPEIAEFIALAKGVGGWEHKGGAYKLHQRALPKPIDRAAGRAALAELRRAL